MTNVMDRLLDAVEWHELPPPEDKAQDGYATYQGVLVIGDATFRCYVLSDGRRLIDADDVQKFLGLWEPAS